MNKIYKYNNYLHRALQIFIGLDIIYRCKESISDLIVYFGLFLIIVINDQLRRSYFYKSVKKYYLSILVSMIISFVLELSVDGYIDIYFYMILYELILYTEGKISRVFISLQIITLLVPIFYKIGIEDISNLKFWQANIIDIFMIFMFIFFYCLSLFSYKILRKEKLKVESLNKELELSYEKLREQAKKIEDLTIAKERNRLAGEIHDNLGHSLIALNMNLDVAEKTIDKDVEKTKDLIHKSQELVKESIENLRKAVYALKEEKPKDFVKSIEEIAENIESTGSVKVVLNIDREAENLPPEYKEVLYSTIKEALTNSIKHGKANEISIDINIEEYVKLVIKDNGTGCKKLVKGNGLLGIESRVKDYNGKVFLTSKSGFEIQLLLPN